MGTISSNLPSSTSTPATTDVSSLTGNTQTDYTADLQSAVDRAVAMASLPITQMQTEVTGLTNQFTEMNTLGGKFSTLQTAIANLDTAVGSGSIGATVSDPSIVSAAVGQGALAGTYSIEVTDLGAYATAMTSDTGTGIQKVADPATQNISASSSYTLTVGTNTFTITPAANTLDSLVSAINSTPGANVQATMVNVGSSSAPDYRLSLQSTKLGDIALQLNDGTNDLMTQQVQGDLASYKVNGESQAATSDSRTVTIAPGLTLTLLKQSATGVAANVTLAQQGSSISSALSSLVSAYNAAATELNNNRGQSGGALSGNSLVYELSNTLEQLTNYFVPSANVTSLASLGVTLDKTGQMSFDSPVFSSAFTSDPAGVASFLGGAATGGFLKTATDALNGVEDSTTGAITTATNSLKSEIISMNKQIGDQQAVVSQLQTNLQSQMAAADTAIAAMEQQSSFLSQMFQAEMVSGQLMSSGL